MGWRAPVKDGVATPLLTGDGWRPLLSPQSTLTGRPSLSTRPVNYGLAMPQLTGQPLLFTVHTDRATVTVHALLAFCEFRGGHYGVHMHTFQPQS